MAERGKSTLVTWNQRRGSLGAADTLYVVQSRTNVLGGAAGTVERGEGLTHRPQ